MVHCSVPVSLRALLCVGAAAVLLAVALTHQQSNELSKALLTKDASVKGQLQELYDIPNFVYQRTQMHFPQAEENWLNMAAAGKIGDDVKPEPILNKLNNIIADARTHALTENYEARVKAKKRAIEDNYSTYDVQKGKVVHKIYGKQVGGSMTLKQQGNQAPTLKSTNSPATLQSSTVQQLSQLPSVHHPKAATVSKPYAVKVPAGLHAGQKFIAQVPGFGRMLVTVPSTVRSGQLVSIQVPFPAKAVRPSVRKASKAKAPPKAHGPQSEHPIAARMLDSALQSHDREVEETSASYEAGDTSDDSGAAAGNSASEHPNAANMLDSALKAHYAASRRARRLPAAGAAGDDRRFAFPGSEHPVAAGMLNEALDNHYHSTPHNVFGLEH